MYQEIMSKIMEIVNNDENIAKEFYPLVTEEVFEKLFTKLSEISTPEDLQTYKTRMKEAKSPQHLQTIINEVAVTVYGEKAGEELRTEYINQIEKIQKNMNDARELIQKAQQGDTQAKQQLEQVKQTETYKHIVNGQSST
jgi:hypothetical protein